MGEKRIRHYDIAKGIGIILVVIGHSMIEFGHYIIYMFHMPLFFFLSGIFFKQDNTRTIIKRQSLRLLVPLIIFSVIIIAVGHITDLTAQISLPPPHFRGLIGPLWFLVALFIVTIVHNILIRTTKDHTTIILLTVTALAIFGYVADRLELHNYIYIYSCMSVLIFYTVGSIFGKDISRYITHNKLLFIIISFALLICMYLLNAKFLNLRVTALFDNQHSNNFIVWILGTIAGISLILSLAMYLDRINRISSIIAIIGECSLYIFAFHLTALNIAHKIHPNPNILTELLFIALSILLGCLSRPILHRLSPLIFR